MNGRELVRDAVTAGVLAASEALGWGDSARTGAVEIERPAERAHGDYAANIAMRLAKPLSRPPFEIAKAIADRMPVRERHCLSGASATGLHQRAARSGQALPGSRGPLTWAPANR